MLSFHAVTEGVKDGIAHKASIAEWQEGLRVSLVLYSVRLNTQHDAEGRGARKLTPKARPMVVVTDMPAADGSAQRSSGKCVRERKRRMRRGEERKEDALQLFRLHVEVPIHELGYVSVLRLIISEGRETVVMQLAVSVKAATYSNVTD